MEYTCIVCPRGCHLTADWATDEEGKKYIKVSGNACPRGEKYAIEEMTMPMRTVTSSVYVRGGEEKMASVKTSDTVPKEQIGEVLRAISALEMEAPIRVGQVLIENVAGTGKNVVATRNVLKA